MLLAGCGGNAEQADVSAASINAHPGKEIYDQYCYSCHNPGLNGAPRLGDAEAWAPRLEKGMDTLVQSVTNGLNAMPPRGLCMDCTADQYKALIKYMSTPK